MDSNNGFRQPFIHKISTKNRKYIYCVNTNGIFETNDVIYFIIDHFNCWPDQLIIDRFKWFFNEEDIKQALSTLREFSNKYGAFLPKLFKGYRIGIDEKEYEYLLNNKMRHLTLITTEDCNLRCAYCLYDPSNKYMRTHNKKAFTYDTAKEAVDFFVPRNRDSNFAGIGFYGGEPFLNFRLMENCLEYFKSEVKKSKKKVEPIVNTTTNGTLIDDERAKWLVNNRVTLIVSLDGPKEIHDRYRKSRNGRGSFEKVMNTLKMLKKYDANYLKTKVTINIVDSPPYRHKEVLEFIKNTDIFELVHIRVSFTSPYDSSHFLDRLPKSKKLFPKESDDLFENLKKALIAGEIDRTNSQYNYQLSLMGRNFISIYNRHSGNLGNGYAKLKPCVIGYAKFAVNSDGYFLPCANTNDKVDNLHFGDLKNGFYRKNGKLMSYQRMLELVDLINVKCTECWAQRICNKLCYIYYRPEMRDTLKDLTHACRGIRRDLQYDLEQYLEVEEVHSNAFDYLKGLRTALDLI